MYDSISYSHINMYLYLIAPSDVITCDIISTNVINVTATGGAITYGTQNVIIYCLCMRGQVAVGAGGASWFVNSTRITRNQDDGSNHPYFKRSVPFQLIIPSFVNSHIGRYSCGPSSDFSDVSSRGDSIDLTLGMYV